MTLLTLQHVSPNIFGYSCFTYYNYISLITDARNINHHLLQKPALSAHISQTLATFYSCLPLEADNTRGVNKIWWWQFEESVCFSVHIDATFSLERLLHMHPILIPCIVCSLVQGIRLCKWCLVLQHAKNKFITHIFEEMSVYTRMSYQMNHFCGFRMVERSVVWWNGK